MAQRIFIWPVIGLVVTGMVHLGIEAVWPGLKEFFVPAAIAPLLLAYGIWIGYRAIGAGASYLVAVAAGIVIGLLPLGLEIIGFGLILGRGVDHGILSGVYGMSYITFGALLGAGYAQSGMSTNA